MEEILASIRRIIADDDATKTSPKPSESPKTATHPTEQSPPPLLPAASTQLSQDEIEDLMSAPAIDPPPVSEKRPAVQPAEDILDLTEAMELPPTPVAFRRIDGTTDVVFNEPLEATPPSVASATAEPPVFPRSDAERVLLSPATSAAVDGAFNALAQTVLVQNCRTLDDLVREMLRPMLKQWLDDNLPNMVERLVRAEIERVSRGRG